MDSRHFIGQCCKVGAPTKQTTFYEDFCFHEFFLAWKNYLRIWYQTLACTCVHKKILRIVHSLKLTHVRYRKNTITKITPHTKKSILYLIYAKSNSLMLSWYTFSNLFYFIKNSFRSVMKYYFNSSTILGWTFNVFHSTYLWRHTFTLRITSPHRHRGVLNLLLHCFECIFSDQQE